MFPFKVSQYLGEILYMQALSCTNDLPSCSDAMQPGENVLLIGALSIICIKSFVFLFCK